MIQKLQSPAGAIDDNSVSLTECLESFTREEELEDGAWYVFGVVACIAYYCLSSWREVLLLLQWCSIIYAININFQYCHFCCYDRYCSGCKKHQKGKMTQRLYRLPDILVIHIKRFNMTARFREKIRSKVVYPLTGLDMAHFCANKRSEGGSDEASTVCWNGVDYPTTVTEGNDIFDLYGVSNHIGIHSFTDESNEGCNRMLISRWYERGSLHSLCAFLFLYRYRVWRHVQFPTGKLFHPVWKAHYLCL